MDITEKYIDGLNDKQKEAVLHGDGPMLILAGAGSGKTRVLTHRIARLVDERGIRPWNIMAITFTNKAAKEMKERIESLIGFGASEMWISTFHSACVRILRRDIEKLGYDRNFVIYDSGDQQTLIKDCLKELNYNDKNFPPRSVLEQIGTAKDELIDPVSYVKMNQGDFRLDKIGNIYTLYQKKLHENNALDFDDLIRLTVKLFNEAPAVLEYYQKKFRYILVDEYQDTNTSQYTLVNMLSEGHGNLCVVGDDDQSIYGWRGANIRNILEFEKDHKGCKVIKLEQNYRSTPNILEIANCVIKNNRGRKSKQLWTDNERGFAPLLYKAGDQYDEGRFVADTTRKTVGREEFKYGDIAVLYRTNAQSRVFEEQFMKEGIPYRMYGGLKFYDRKEIRDVIAYLRVILNSSDNISLKRIINVPRRGIGAATVEKAERIALEEGVSIFSVISKAEQYTDLARAEKKLKGFCSLINSLKSMSEVMPVSTLIDELNDKSDIISEYELENTPEARTRIENIKEFGSVAIEFEKGVGDDPEEKSLEAFLAQISLVSDVDELNEENGAVTLMTIHSSKGLEFPMVFLVGMEEGIFPGMRSMESEEEMEEERRLCYVGITRAKKVLYLTHAFARTIYGKTERYMPSRFLSEIPEELIEPAAGSSSQPLGWQNVPTGVFNKGIYKQVNTSKGGFDGDRVSFGSGPVQRGFTANSASAASLSVGQKVIHKKFGTGVIKKLEGEGKSQQAEIEFEGVGMRRLMTAYANLQEMK